MKKFRRHPAAAVAASLLALLVVAARAHAVSSTAVAEQTNGPDNVDREKLSGFSPKQVIEVLDAWHLKAPLEECFTSQWCVVVHHQPPNDMEYACLSVCLPACLPAHPPGCCVFGGACPSGLCIVLVQTFLRSCEDGWRSLVCSLTHTWHHTRPRFDGETLLHSDRKLVEAACPSVPLVQWGRLWRRLDRLDPRITNSNQQQQREIHARATVSTASEQASASPPPVGRILSESDDLLSGYARASFWRWRRRRWW